MDIVTDAQRARAKTLQERLRTHGAAAISDLDFALVLQALSLLERVRVAGAAEAVASMAASLPPLERKAHDEQLRAYLGAQVSAFLIATGTMQFETYRPMLAERDVMKAGLLVVTPKAAEIVRIEGGAR